jgi:hypothetical protein
MPGSSFDNFATLDPGGTTTLQANLYSENGYPNPITVAVNNVTPGWTVTVDKQTVSSLPIGKTPITVTFTAPAGALPGATGSAHLQATSGSVVRPLNGGGVYNPTGSGGNATATVKGVVLPQYDAGTSPFAAYFWKSARTSKALISLGGLGITGPVALAVQSTSPGVTASLNKSSVTVNNGILSDNVELTVSVASSAGLGAHPITLTATAADGKVSQSTFDVYVLGVDAPFPSAISLNKAAGSTGTTAVDVMVGGVESTNVQISFPNPPTGISLTASPSVISLPASGRNTARVEITATATQMLTPGTRSATIMYTFSNGNTTTFTFPINVN